MSVDKLDPINSARWIGMERSKEGTYMYTYSSKKCCWGPIIEPGRHILIQAMASACVNL